MISIKEAKILFDENCVSLFEQNERDEIFGRVMEHITMKGRLECKLDKSLMLPKNELQEIIDQLLLHKPIQYILGYEWFDDIQLLVNEAVLIPRPETIELVHWIQKLNANIEKISIIDIGTGSGCIPIWLKNKFPTWKISAIDISEEALKVAQLNASIHEQELLFYNDDILFPQNQYPQFDIVVSNPPYITEIEKQEMDSNVLQHEPHEALFVTNNDALQFYKSISFFCVSNLKPEGMVFMEVNKTYAQEVATLFIEQGFETEIRKDIFGNDRMVRAFAKKIA